ncbi:DNA-binding IclR family transcriptional regulator [Kineosphaera limosa]|uniref:Putative IclR family transcriptional regulator n=1 Tax=Kineosphaera limosa NBRC 100340 TaxID=1184609 RepID=K6WSI9_9MICO|nr:IclR family transcriptional regulator [Kineosphaera limosa]NYE00692.1 DNA-binding IclR family transcriptional regulator [Kineosphaera limosa]GAB96781.1 putative IclR family transcriptional regulator [Kineosphaera limosa NBRC 100340]
MAQTGTQSIDRAADLLARILGAGGEPVTFTQLCDEAGYPRSTTSRILAALERHELLRRDGSGGWGAGAVIEQYANGQDRHEHLVREAMPVMEELGEKTGETINFGIALGHRVVQVAQVDSAYFLGSRDWVGVDLPAHTSALGKALYAAGAIPAPTGALDQRTEQTIADARSLVAQFEQIRRRGYAVTMDELEIGLTGIAAPVRRGEVVVAALGLSGPTSRLASTIESTAQDVVTAAATISARLGRSRTEGAA